MQGKIDLKKVAEGLKKGMKKKDIAVMAGSLATSDSAKIQAVNNTINSSQFQEKMAKKVEMANDSLTQDKLDNTNAVGLATIIDKLSRISGLATQQSLGDQHGTNISAQNVLVQYGIIDSQQKTKDIIE